MYKTLTGLTLEEVAALLQEKLEDGAYKSISAPGGGTWTDIGSAYTREALTDSFGLCGFGWWYETGPIRAEHVEKQRSGGQGTYSRWEINYDEFKLYFRVQDEDGNVVNSQPIVSNGSNDNDDYGYAVRGARTNGIGDAAKMLLWQLPIWKGQMDAPKSGGGTSQGPIVMKSGKHEGKTLAEIEPDDPDFIDWMARDASSPRHKAAAQAIVDSRPKEGAPENTQEDDVLTKARADLVLTMIETVDSFKTEANVNWYVKNRMGYPDLKQVTLQEIAEIARIVKGDLHWSETTRADMFWKVLDEIGVPRDMAHEVLEVEKVQQFVGPVAKALTVAKKYAEEHADDTA